MISIDKAKEIIKETIKVYLQKDDKGEYIIPIERQRPIFLLGAPGIGKTEIVKQVALNLNLGFVSYTMTHHTRQTALGLPMIVEKNINGNTYSATEYTMSEIIDSIYTVIKEEGKEEGVLFIDEINCVSETLSPLMLDLLQNKRFGSHKLPKGWVLISAGNPPEFNSAARAFDIATSDRLKIIKVEANCDDWLIHARQSKANAAVVYYLRLNKDKLFCISRKDRTLSIVTPRGWEDLSKILTSYEKLGYEVSEELCEQYLQDEDIAKDFFTKYRFFREFAGEIELQNILESGKGDYGKIKNAQFDEKVALIELIIKEVNLICDRINKKSVEGKGVFELAKKTKGKELDNFIAKQNAKNAVTSRRGMEEKKAFENTISILDNESGDSYSEKIQNYLKNYEKEVAEIESKIKNSADFIVNTFGEGEEILTYLTGLLKCEPFNEYLLKNKSETIGNLQKYLDEDCDKESIMSLIREIRE